MVDPTTSNIQLAQPTRGSDTGVWDVPLNNNSAILDLCLGGIANIALNNVPVTLAASQYECKTLIFTSTLAGNVTVTFPTSFIKSYEIYNLCTGSSAYVVTLSNGGGNVVCAPPQEGVDVVNTGAGGFNYKNLGRIGQYWDYAGSSVPAWVSGCTVPPYLNCDGTAFSSATYPYLSLILGGTTLPDSRGRTRMAADQSAARVSSAVSGFAPNTVGAGGGAQSVTIAQANLPAHTHSINDPGHNHAYVMPSVQYYNGGGGAGYNNITNTVTGSAYTGITVLNSTYANSAMQNMQPTYVGGLTLIRAA